MFRQAIHFAGFIVREAGDGPAALHMIDDDPPDLVVLDLLLPTLDGLSVLSEMAAHGHTRHIPVVIVTGSTLNVDPRDVSCVLRKPVSPGRLIAAIQDGLHSGATR